ncbi:hypothetical protein CRE_22777 [Caenorhabditis remanei]|uniref:Uncharacterized protein n=1 Tax=Caenorhabditis remanei TaxID=31234 RepID=E3MHG0_CAERE|nr:hypothetical protein CRE_22777 [Caenorhabditis remanei]
MSSDEVTVKTDCENEYCYRCVPLSQVEQMKENTIYNLCEKYRWIAAHTLLSSTENSSKLTIREEIQRALTCSKCPPMNSLSEIEKLKAEITEECVLDLDRYVERFLSIELSASEGFNAQKVFDSAFKCQKCPKIETTSQYEQMWAKIVVMMRRYDRDAALKTVRDANDAFEKQKRIEASLKSAYDGKDSNMKTCINN